MPPSFELVICIASTALFDCSESHEIWKNHGLEAYKEHQRVHGTIPLKPGVGFALVRSLLELNEVAGESLVEVILVSRNNGDSGERIRCSIAHHNLRITRMSFTGGTDVTKYLSAWKCDLFLSTEEQQVRKVLSGPSPNPFEGIAAGLVCDIMAERNQTTQTGCLSAETSTIAENGASASPDLSQWREGQVRIAFDGDGVLFSDEAERVSQAQGLPAFYQHERERSNTVLPKGPLHAFAFKLQKVRRALGQENRWRLRTFLVTARNDVANLRVFHTLKEWGLEIDETHFLGGLDKTPFLRAIDPAIFFDDSSENIDRAKLHIPSAHVVYGIHSTSIPSPVILLPISQHSKNEE